jgi:nucleoside-diphosphate-sugar epimerase
VSVREIVERLALRFPQAGPVRFSGAARAGDPAHYEADISAARGWGWEPTIALDAGISGYVDWFHAEVA